VLPEAFPKNKRNTGVNEVHKVLHEDSEPVESIETGLGAKDQQCKAELDEQTPENWTPSYLRLQ